MSETGYTDGTSGHSGSDTSQSRAERERDTGTKSARERRVLGMLAGDPDGWTVKELRVTTGLHHGQASSVLSVLHKDGRIARLHETRGRCKVYVALDQVHGRATEPHGGRTKVDSVRIVEQVREAVHDWEVHGYITDADALQRIRRIVGAQ